MFNFRQLDLDLSFTVQAPTILLSEVIELFSTYQYIIINLKTKGFSVLEQSLSPLLKEWTPSQSIHHFLTITNWPIAPSYKNLTIHDIPASKEPIIFIDQNKNIQGILSPDKHTAMLKKEYHRMAAFFYTLAETVNDAVTALNQEGEVICWNSVAEKTYGISKNEIIGRKIGKHFNQEAVMLHRILDEGRPVRQVYSRPTAQTHVLINASPIISDNQVVGGIATEQDITSIVRLNEELYSTMPRMEEDHPFQSIIGMGSIMKQALQLASKMASLDTPLFISGEHGTGKEAVAHAVHCISNRKEKNFTTVNCSALPPALLETELFGYQGGAFSGNEQLGKPGKLEESNDGTLYIEDIDKLPKDIQLKLLTYLKNGIFQRVGSVKSQTANTRIIASSSVDLKEQMEKGEFHEDLFYQLQTAKIEIPSLRDRPEDIPELIQSFLREFSIQYHKPIPKIDPSAMIAFMNYDWPGNVKELKSMVERTIILNEDDSISLVDLPRPLSDMMYEGSNEENGPDITLKAKVSEQEEALMIDEALRKTFGNKSAAAKLLGISRGTLYNKMKEYGL